MSIQEITKDQLRRMEDQEGLILQGCGGDPQEWLDGINQMLTANGCLREGTTFQQVSSFDMKGSTCLLFHFTDDVKLDVSKLAAWRLASHSSFGGTWLSDFVPNHLGGFVQDQPEQVQEQGKPDCPLIGQNGNIYTLIGIASSTLRKHDMEDQAKEMFQRITQCQSYDSALNIIGDYVNITSTDDIGSGMAMDEMC